MLRRVNPLPSSRLQCTAFEAVSASTSVARSTGSRRIRRAGYFGRLAALAAAFCLCAASAAASTWMVDTLTDDSTTTSAAAQTNCASGNSGTCALRDAILAAAADDSINFGVTGTISLTSALPPININLTITGPGANLLTVSGAGNFQVLSIGTLTTANVTISGLTIADGQGGSAGGAITLGTGTLSVNNSAFTGNTAVNGGAIESSGTLTVTGSTFTGNQATGNGNSSGGAIYFNSTAGALTITNSTLSGNSAVDGGAIFSQNAATLVNDTLSGNSATIGGAIDTANTVTVENSIIAGNSATSLGGDIAGDKTLNNNVFFNNHDNCGCGDTQPPVASNPLALPLSWYGGPTQTFLPLPGSAAICAGSASLASAVSLTTDQRGFALNPGNYNACSAGSVDAGAVQTNYIQVTSGGDAGTGASDCQTVPNTTCTLRDVVGIANGSTTPNVYGDIDFASGLKSVTLSAGTLELSSLTGVNIAGPAANQLTINGGGSASNFTVVTVDAGVPALLYGLTISKGNTTNPGGGINNSGTLSIVESAISGNAVGSGNPGGGINSSGALTVVDSTISGNTAGGDGGGLANQNSGTISLTESTVSGNTAGTEGGGLGGGLVNAGNSITLVESTVTGNAVSCSGAVCAVDGGGIGSFGGTTTTAANSIIAGNAVTCSGCGPGFADINGPFTDDGGNLASTSSSATSTINPKLGPLALNGTATVQTMIPLLGSPAICAGLAANIPAGNTTDQRGEPNTNASYPGFTVAAPCVDAGSVQTNYAMSFTTSPPPSVTVDESFGAAVTLNESGNPFSAASVNIPITLSSGTLTGTATEATSAGVATYSGLSATLGSDVNLSATVSLNPALATPLSLSAASSDFSVGQAQTSATISSSSTSSTVDQSLTLTSIISPNVTNPVSAANTIALTGSVTFANNGTALACSSTTFNYTASTGTAKATCVTSALPAGSNSKITATYGGDTSYQPSPASADAPTITVAEAGTTTKVSANPSAPALNQSVTFTALVTFPATLTVLPGSTDTVTFSDNGANLTNCGTGDTTITATATANVYQATCQLASLSGGSHEVVAQFNGDSNYTTSSANLSLSIAQGSSTTTVASSLNPSTVNAPVSFTVSVAGGSTESVTGTATVTADGSNTLGECTLSGWTSTTPATCSVPGSSLSVGSHTITASYSGNTSYSSSATGTPQLMQMVNKATTSLTVTSSSTNNTSSINSSVTFTAQVTLPSGATTPTGTVAFSYTPSGASSPVVSICSASSLALTGTSGGTATYTAACPTSTLPIGAFTISAAYAGDSNFLGSSGATSQTVNAANSTTSISAELTPSTVDQTVSFQATVSAPSGNQSPTGKMNFTDTVNGTTGPLCSNVVLSGGVYLCTTPALIQGTHTITANYPGDSNFQASSASTTQMVKVAPSTLMLTPAASTVAANDVSTLTFTATVVPSSGPIFATGNVVFTDTSGTTQTMLCTTAVNAAGVATCTPTALPSGANSIQASYAGDANFAPVAAGAGPTVSVAVQDFGLTLSGPASVNGVPVVTVTAGSTNSNDLFSPVAISVTPSSISAYSGTVTLGCTSSSTGAPACTFPPSLSVASGGTQQGGTIGIDATSASPGSYNFTLTGTDSVTGLTHSLTFTVVVRSMAGPLSLVSGATTGNTANVNFVLPAGVSLSSLECLDVVGTGITSQNVPPSAVSIGCTFNPATIASSATLQTGTTVVTVSTSGTTTASLDRHSSLLFAGLFGLPLFGLLGFRRGRKSMRAIALRLVALLALTAAAYQLMGCGGSFQRPPATNGQTPAGQYFLLIQGTGAPGNGTYQAVLELNVSL
jgi:hypothetical protein